MYMVKKTRSGVFETNSSSTHSVSISSINSDDVLDRLRVGEDGNVVITGRTFGCEVEEYNDVETKASYAAIYALMYSGDMRETFVDALTECIKRQTGCDSVIYKIDGDYYSSIDHQSVDYREFDYLFHDASVLRDFLFNKKSILFTGNDND